MSVDEGAVSRHAVASLETDPVARDQAGAGHADESVRRARPRPGGGERLEACQGRLGSLFLVEAEGSIEEQNHGDGQGFDGPPVRPFVDPQARIEDEREEQDVDEGARNWRTRRRQAGSGARSGRALGPTSTSRAAACAVESPGKVTISVSSHPC